MMFRRTKRNKHVRSTDMPAPEFFYKWLEDPEFRHLARRAPLRLTIQ